MAITNSQPTPQATQQTTQPNQQQTRQTNQTSQGQGWSLSGASLFGAPISRGLGSESLLKLQESLAKVYESMSDPDAEITLIPVDRVNDPDLVFSSIVVCLRKKSNPHLGVAAHVLIVEATGDKPSPVFINAGNQQIEITRVTSDAFDKVLIDIVTNKIKAAFPQQPIYIVDGCVVPREFNSEDKFHIHLLALNAGLATNTELKSREPNFPDYNIAANPQDSNLIINVLFQRQQLVDAVGSAVRSDVLVNFTSQRQQPQQQPNVRQSLNSGSRDSKISQLSGFVDLLWAPIIQSATFNPWMAQQPQQSQKYVARLVLTDMMSNFSYTLSSMLLSLYTALSLRDDNNWIQTFRPSPVSNNEIDLHDIGALNIEANLTQDPSGFGQRIDTKSENFRLEDLGQLVSSLIQPGLMVSFDVPEFGPQTWYMAVFAAAASGNQAAYDMIFNSAMQLTNGAFGKYFTKGSQMFTDTGNRVHLGYWIDKTGQKCDLRDIDYLAVANIVGDRSPALIRDWSDTWMANRAPNDVRMNHRRKMLIALSNESAEFTGFAQRVTCTNIFLDALVHGVREAGLNPSVNTPLSTADFNNQRGVANFVNNALLQPGQAFFNSSQGYGSRFTDTQYQNPRW